MLAAGGIYCHWRGSIFAGGSIVAGRGSFVAGMGLLLLTAGWCIGAGCG